MDLPTPANLEGLVAGRYGRHDVIVVAVVSEISELGIEATAAWDLADGPEPNGAGDGPGTAYTRFRLSAEQVFLDDGSLAGGEPLLIRRIGQPGYPYRDYPLEKVGDRYLYFLRADGEDHYSDWGPYSRLIVDGEDVRYTDPDGPLVEFALGTPPAEFLDAVATEVAIQYATPMPLNDLPQ